MVLVDELACVRLVVATANQMRICSSKDCKDSESKLVVKHDAQQGAVDFQPVLGINEPQFLEFVHE